MPIQSMKGPADVAAISGIIAAFIDRAPLILGVLGGLLGVGWYCVLFYDRFVLKKPTEDQDGHAG